MGGISSISTIELTKPTSHKQSDSCTPPPPHLRCSATIPSGPADFPDFSFSMAHCTSSRVNGTSRIYLKRSQKPEHSPCPATHLDLLMADGFSKGWTSDLPKLSAVPPFRWRTCTGLRCWVCVCMCVCYLNICSTAEFWLKISVF